MTVRQSNFKDDKIVRIKPEAYYKMLVHVLRFGNKARDHRQFKEVMGILIGRLEGEPDSRGVRDVIVEDYVPISHGGSIEVAFKPEDYVSFSYVDAEYAERDPPLFSVGWAHSHPGLKIFFSSTDIKNQLGWQTPNPSAIGIVFDHTYLENPGDLGFRTFRLDDPSKGPLSDYHEVKTIVEPPDSVEFYIKLMELINSIHSKEPPILELNETPDLFGDIMIPGQSQIMAKQPELELNTIIEAFQASLNEFIRISLNPIVRFFNSWSQDLIKRIVDNNLTIRNDLVALKDNISLGMNEIQSTVKSVITNKLYDLDAYIDDILESFDKDQERIKGLFENLKDEISKQLTELLNQIIESSIKQLTESFHKIIDSLQEVIEREEELNNNLKTQQDSLNELQNTVNGMKEPIINTIKDSQKNIITKITEKLESFSKETGELNKKLKESADDFDAALLILQNSKDSIKKKINDLENKLQQSGGN
ncbi:MAG: hypothetical protein ACP6IY_05370 [Promethearchaeia archaeon]